MPSNQPWTVERTSPGVVTIRVPMTRRNGHIQSVLLVSDQHHDSAHSDHDMETRHLEEARRRGAPVLMAGDTFCAMQGKFDRRADKRQIHPDVWRDMALNDRPYLDAITEFNAAYYSRYADVIGMIGMGNHEYSIADRHETNLTERLAERIRAAGGQTVAAGCSGWVRVLFPRAHGRSSSVAIYWEHGGGGAAPVTRGLIRSARQSVRIDGADVIWSGHDHNEWAMPMPVERINMSGLVEYRQVWHVRTGGYQEGWQRSDGRNSWPHVRAMGPKLSGAVWLNIAYERRDRVTRREGYSVSCEYAQ